MPLLLRRERCCRCGDVCTACCYAGESAGFTERCCLGLKSITKPHVTAWSASWSVESNDGPLSGETANASFTMAGGPYEITKRMDGDCEVTINVNGSWTSSLSEDVQTFTNEPLTIRLDRFSGWWTMDFPHHPDSDVDCLAPHDCITGSVSGEHTCSGVAFSAPGSEIVDCEDCLGFQLDVLSAEYELTIGDPQLDACEWDSLEGCICL